MDENVFYAREKITVQCQMNPIEFVGAFDFDEVLLCSSRHGYISVIEPFVEDCMQADE